MEGVKEGREGGKENEKGRIGGRREVTSVERMH